MFIAHSANIHTFSTASHRAFTLTFTDCQYAVQKYKYTVYTNEEMNETVHTLSVR